jgi:hypothetical protein
MTRETSRTQDAPATPTPSKPEGVALRALIDAGASYGGETYAQLASKLDRARVVKMGQRILRELAHA